MSEDSALSAEIPDMNVGTGGYGRAVATGIAPADGTARHESLGAGLRRVPPLIPALAVVFAVTVAAGWSVVHLLDSVAAWDTHVIEDLASGRTSRLNTLTGYGTWLADSVTSIVLVLVAIVVARIVTKQWTWSIFLALALGSEKLIYLVSSIIVGRDRPPVPTIGETFATDSFPSGHVGTAMALYGGIAVTIGAITGRRALRNGLLVLAVLITAVVAYCRMYRGFHYPTDVLVGAALGTICLILAWWRLGRKAPS